MAVIALGRLRVSETRDLAVIGFKIGRGNLLVAASAGAHYVQPEGILIGAMDGMSGVAIVADRKRLAVSAHLLGMDAVFELLLDTVVTLAASRRHVVGVHARRGIGSGEDMVSGVTTGASGRHRQAILQQGSVDALGVVGDDFVLRSRVAHGSFLPLAVAARAQAGNIDRERGGLRILLVQDSVGAMAFLAGGGIRIIFGGQLSVNAGRVQLANLVVAGGAVHSFSDGLAGTHTRGIYLRVALAAGNSLSAVHRMAHFVQIDEHGLSVARAAQFLVRVATHAIRVGHTHLVEDVPDLMGLMAVGAGGQDVGLFFPELSTNRLAVDYFDLRVAFGACTGNVLAIDRGSGVGVRQYGVGGMAGGASGSDRQSLLHQRLAVDALGVVLENIVLGNLAIARDWSSFAMALTANQRYFQGRHCRAWVFHGKDVMVSR